jgi:hypothetical protein
VKFVGLTVVAAVADHGCGGSDVGAVGGRTNMPVRKSKSKPKPKPNNVMPPMDPKYYSKWVAWAKDERVVIASGDVLKEVEQQVIDLGYDVEQVPFQFVEPPQFRLPRNDGS